MTAIGWVENVVAEHALGSLVDDVVEEDLTDEAVVRLDREIDDCVLSDGGFEPAAPFVWIGLGAPHGVAIGRSESNRGSGEVVAGIEHDHILAQDGNARGSRPSFPSDRRVTSREKVAVVLR